ncbi:MAG: hypothetical protein JWL69_2715 [Phycisphaerales bacterium]|nr:hypothetical protein [Phycisphaerales bacterium]MDB5354606.1 hypothetical protein [Phycisphaerales bacterium]
MPPANIEADPFFVLLTDALRAGPGSPAWHDAVSKLREQGAQGNDEYTLLIAARENLEGGKEYRAVRPGPDFTRKVMQGVDEEPVGGRPRSIPTATLLAIFCGIAILAALGYVGYRMSQSEPSAQAAIDDLQNKANRFFDTAAAASFTGPLPQGWQKIGALPLDTADGLRPAPAADSGTAAKGGGVAWSGTMPADQAFALEVSVRSLETAGPILLEAFVSTDPKFSAETGTSSHDLVWQLQGQSQRVIVGGNGRQLSETPAPFVAGNSVRLVVDRDVAIIEVSAPDKKWHRIWAGAHEMGASPRSVGVRFLQTGPAPQPQGVVQQVKITTSSVK